MFTLFYKIVKPLLTVITSALFTVFLINYFFDERILFSDHWQALCCVLLSFIAEILLSQEKLLNNIEALEIRSEIDRAILQDFNRDFEKMLAERESEDVFFLR